MSKYGGEVDVSGTFLEAPPGLDPDCLLFLGDPNKQTQSLFQRVWMPASMTVFCLGSSLFSNRSAKMPYRAGLYKHFLAILMGYGIGEGAWRLQNKYAGEKDLQYYHYMVMHPEDFQAPERKKYSHVIRPWIPMR